MSIKKTITVNAETEDAVKAIARLEKQMSDLDNQVKDISESTKDIQKSTKSAAKGFRGIGLAIKAAGVGLVLKAFSMLKDIMSSNQKVVDAATTSFNFLAIAFNDLFKFIESNVEPVRQWFKEIFENPQETLKNLGEAIKANLVERFESLIEVAGLVGKTVKHLFAGEWNEAFETAKEAGKELVDVATGVDNSVEKIADAVTTAADALVDYATTTWEAADAMTELNNQSQIAEARNERLLKGFMLQAERLRQVRDDERKTIDERIKANDDLADVLDEQERVMLENANLGVRNAKAKLALDENNVEAQVELENAMMRLLDVEETVAGFRSEQLVNEMGLQREQLELQDLRTEGENKVLEILRRGDIETETNMMKRANTERQLTITVFENERARLQSKIDSLTEGTIAHQQAINELEVLEANHTNYLRGESQKRSEQAKSFTQQSVAIAAQAFGALSEMNLKKYGEEEEEQKKAFEENKKAQISLTRVNTLTAIVSALAAPGVTPFPIKIANAATAALIGAANIKKIRQTEFQSSEDGTDSATKAASVSVTPDINIVAASNTNSRLAQMADQNGRPMRAYVTAQDVTSAAALERNVIERSSLTGK